MASQRLSYNTTSLSLEDFALPPERWSSPQLPANNVNGETFLDYIILGDCFASGPGVEAVFPGDPNVGDKDCVRRVGAWGPQVCQSSLYQNPAPTGFGVPQDHFLACSGGDTESFGSRSPVHPPLTMQKSLFYQRDLDGDGRADYLEVDPNTSAITAYFNGCPGVVG